MNTEGRRRRRRRRACQVDPSSRARLAARHQEGRPKEIIVIELQLTWGLRSEQQRSLHTNIYMTGAAVDVFKTAQRWLLMDTRKRETRKKHQHRVYAHMYERTPKYVCRTYEKERARGKKTFASLDIIYYRCSS